MILFWVALAWLAATSAASLGLAALWPLALVAGAGASLALLRKGSQGEALLLAVVLLAVLLGIDRYEGARPSRLPEGVALLNGEKQVQLRGVVVQEPEERERSQRLVLQAEALRDGDRWVETSGKVLVSARLFPRFAYGDVLELKGAIDEPPVFKGFDYRDYLARKGIASVSVFPGLERVGEAQGSGLTRFLIDLRRPFAEALRRAMPEPESALARGILLGQRASIPADVNDDFNRAGISHLIAISGYNVMLVAGFAMATLTPLLGRRQATLAAMVLVPAYALFVVDAPSVIRAAIMAEVMLGAIVLGRPGSSLTVVLFTGAAMTAWQPTLIDDVSFQLSFGATLGIVLLAGPLRERVQPLLQRAAPAWLAAFVAEQASVTAAASIAVLPVMASSFGRLSLVSLPANLLAVHAFTLSLAGSFLTAAAGAAHDGAGRLVGELAYLPLAYLVWLGRVASSLPLASLDVAFGTLEAAVFAGLLLGLARALRQRPLPAADLPSPPRLRLTTSAALVMALLAAFVLWDLSQPRASRLTVTMLDVGQGDAILIETPGGHRILVDGGPSGARLAQALGKELGPSERRIDLMVLTHGQDDHVTGLIEVLERFDVLQVLEGPLPGQTGAYRSWQEEVERRRILRRHAVAGEWLDLGRGARLEVVGPPAVPIEGSRDDLNNNSVVLRLVHGSVSFLLTGDIEAPAESALLQSPSELQSTVLKAGHHGSDGSTTPPFLEAVRPRLTLISAGKENNFGHPSPTTRLRLAGIPVLRTDQNGNVRLSTDGRALWVDFERGDYDLVPAGVAP